MVDEKQQRLLRNELFGTPLGEARDELQVVSKQRVEHHGEVLTGSREVNAMLDLVKPETERIESRFLEPACGTGNFLTAILERKLAIVEKRYRRSQPEYERYAVLAVSSVYGVDKLEENVRRCRYRLFEIFDTGYTRLFGDKAKQQCRDAVQFMLARNIIWGNALTLKNVYEADHIVFSEWSLLSGGLMKRRDFTFHELITKQGTALPLVSDIGQPVFIPESHKEFDPVHFLEIARVQQE